MFCSKCGKPIAEGMKICPECENADNAPQVPKVGAMLNVRMWITPKSVIYTVLAIIVLILFITAANGVVEGGSEIAQIESVGGETLEEAYYRQLGIVYDGIGLALVATGIFFSSVLVWLGIKK